MMGKETATQLFQRVPLSLSLHFLALSPSLCRSRVPLLSLPLSVYVLRSKPGCRANFCSVAGMHAWSSRRLQQQELAYH